MSSHDRNHPWSQSQGAHRHRHYDQRAYDFPGEESRRRSRYDDYYAEADRRYYPDDRPRRHRSAHYYNDDPRRGRSTNSGRDHHHNSQGRSHHSRRSSMGPEWKQAAGAAVAAGVLEAFRSRRDPDRTKRVATAAIGAAATDSALLVKDGGGRNDFRGRDKRHFAESVVAGLAENRVINGPRR
ncbi:hypothetical protein F4808DRAFT_438984 [Astrocystis sublimbata]|nr:hypothetical protein F4808DRAFT_438984 [Astrocystis sublimbata]